MVTGIVKTGYDRIYNTFFAPVEANSAGVVSFQIDSGETVTQIGERLQAANLLRDSRVFKYMVQFRGLTNALSYGTFKLSPGMNADQIEWYRNASARITNDNGGEPVPAFLFQHGAGPLFDIGPYYLTALVQTFGSISRVAAIGSKSREQRSIGSGPKAGEVFDVEVPTHFGALLQFADGGSAQSIFSFDSPKVRVGFVEITGTEGTIALPDPNNFDGDVKICKTGSDEWIPVPCEGEVTGRGVGALDMARSIRAGVPHRATGEQAYHIVDAMVSIAESGERGEFVELSSSAPATEALPLDWNPFAATLGA